MKIRFNKKPKYVFHLVLILLAMFLTYPAGNYILGFQEGTETIQYIKMFIFFIIILYLADNIFESWLKV